MVRVIAVALMLIAGLAHSQQNVRIIGDTTGSPIGNTGNALNVTGGSGTFNVTGSTVTTQPLIASNIDSSTSTISVATTVLAANANRKAWKCHANENNTQAIILRADGVAVATSTLARLAPGTSYSETVVVSTTLISAIPISGSQGILCDQKVSP